LKITALEEYGLRSMISLARAGHGNALTIPEIGARENLSVPYVGKLMMILRQAGLVKAVRGRNGGYVLSRPADKIYLSEVLQALGEPVFGWAHCEKYGQHDGNGRCIHIESCTVRHIWDGLNNLIGHILESVSLQQLADGDGNAIDEIIFECAKTKLQETSISN
jgi:Rrf2 family iron-sulfur cluster assembly transcriptional regulator